MSSTLPPGARLGRYEVKSQLGQGGMGEVYLAQDTKLDRKVALKILPAELASHHDRMRRFTQEAKAASALNHPNILTIYEIDETDSGHFIATEFIDGETLREHLRKEPMKLGETLDIATQISGALSAAHAAGIVHRDIKPENIMVRRDGIVKVLDFGLAKLSEPPAIAGGLNVDTEAPTRAVFHTDPGVVMGTAIYMSPEQARGLQVDARTDIFSIGVVIYEMIAGRLPFEGSNTNEILASILSDKEPLPLARYAREVPSELERIVSKALRKDRDQRYQTIKDLLLDLKSLTQELEFEKKLERSFRRGATSVRPPEIRSLAVLPLKSLDASENYLGLGIADAVIRRISQTGELIVRPTSAVRRYLNEDTDALTAARQLSADAVLEGSVQHANERLRVSVNLLRTSDGASLWTDSFDMGVADIFTIQDTMSQQVASRSRQGLESKRKRLDREISERRRSD